MFIVLVVIIYFCLILFFIIELIVSKEAINVTENIIQSPKIPNSFDVFKIVQISELHSEEFGRGNRRLLKTIFLDRDRNLDQKDKLSDILKVMEDEL